MNAGTVLATMAVPILYCPSRRTSKPYTYDFEGVGWVAVNWNNSTTTAVARSDYAANAGDWGTNDGGAWLPTTIAQGMDRTGWPNTSLQTGVAYMRSELPLALISDGTSCTYLFGEKYLVPDNYFNGADPADNENCYVGWDNDMFRVTASNNGGSISAYYPPLPDTPGYATPYPFGSAHAATFNMSLCDGSVRPIAYSINQEVHRQLSNRHDGLPVSTSGY